MQDPKNDKMLFTTEKIGSQEQLGGNSSPHIFDLRRRTFPVAAGDRNALSKTPPSRKKLLLAECGRFSWLNKADIVTANGFENSAKSYRNNSNRPVASAVNIREAEE